MVITEFDFENRDDKDKKNSKGQNDSEKKQWSKRNDDQQQDDDSDFGKTADRDSENNDVSDDEDVDNQ